MLSADVFSKAVEALPLVSLDLCLVNPRRELLLGKRLNKPAQGFWFSPGGRIRKNEPWRDGLLRIGVDELGLSAEVLNRAHLMGVWDHFYDDSALDTSISTHYVNLPHIISLSDEEISQLNLPLGVQHSAWQWLNIQLASGDNGVHPYVQVYAKWIEENSYV